MYKLSVIAFDLAFKHPSICVFPLFPSSIPVFLTVPTEPPSNASCTVTSSTKIYCEWLAVPYHAQKGIITSYSVKYRIYNDPNNLIVSSNSWTRMPGIAPSTLQAEISSLKPYTRYEVKISARTKMGEGTEKWITLETDEDGSYFIIFISMVQCCNFQYFMYACIEHLNYDNFMQFLVHVYSQIGLFSSFLSCLFSDSAYLTLYLDQLTYFAANPMKG